jgi:ribosomal protein S18 acetylase RimI-like enzyme
VTAQNFERVLELCVAPEQEAHIGTVAEALVRAHFFTEERPLAVLDTETDIFIGFVMYRVAAMTTASTFHISRILVDCKYQRRGYGGRVLDMLFESARLLGTARLELYVHRKAEAAIGLYRSRGFEFIADQDRLDHWLAIRTLE